MLGTVGDFLEYAYLIRGKILPVVEVLLENDGTVYDLG